MDKYRFHIGSLLVLILVLSSCKKDSACFHSYGDESSVFIETGRFDSINVRGSYDVNLIHSDHYAVEIVGGENNSKFISIENNDRTLVLDNGNKCNWLRNYENRIQLNVYFNDLKEIRSLGESYIFSKKSLSMDTLFIHITGVGDVDLKLDSVNYIWSELYVLGDLTLSGNMNKLNCKVASFGNLRAEKLEAKQMYIETSHEGDAHVYPVEFLKAECSKIGNIFYYNVAEEVVVIENDKGRYLKGE